MSAESAGTHEFFAACPRHVPDLLATELRGLGLQVTREHPAGVSFSGPLRDGYLACLASRTASRVLLTLGSVPLDSPESLYEAMRLLPWEDHVAPEGTLAIDVVGQGPAWLRHTQFAAQKAKDAIVDRIREHSGARPSVDLASPDLRLNLSLMRERALGRKVMLPGQRAQRVVEHLRRVEPRAAEREQHSTRGARGEAGEVTVAQRAGEADACRILAGHIETECAQFAGQQVRHVPRAGGEELVRGGGLSVHGSSLRSRESRPHAARDARCSGQ